MKITVIKSERLYRYGQEVKRTGNRRIITDAYILQGFKINEYCRYLENSWMGYDFHILDKLENKELLFQPKRASVYIYQKKVRKQ